MWTAILAEWLRCTEREGPAAGILACRCTALYGRHAQSADVCRYHPGEIVVTENGCDVPNESGLPLADALNDTFRVNFYQGYVQAAQQAVNDGVPLKGYFAWSLLGTPLAGQHVRNGDGAPVALMAHLRSQQLHVVNVALMLKHTWVLLGAATVCAVSRAE